MNRDIKLMKQIIKKDKYTNHEIRALKIKV